MKKDYNDKTKEIQELAQSGENGSIDLATWIETYKKLKLKLKGLSLIENALTN